jgi:hypothetical protein
MKCGHPFQFHFSTQLLAVVAAQGLKKTMERYGGHAQWVWTYVLGPKDAEKARILDLVGVVQKEDACWVLVTVAAFSD